MGRRGHDGGGGCVPDEECRTGASVGVRQRHAVHLDVDLPAGGVDRLCLWVTHGRGGRGVRLRADLDRDRHHRYRPDFLDGGDLPRPADPQGGEADGSGTGTRGRSVDAQDRDRQQVQPSHPVRGRLGDGYQAGSLEGMA